MANPYFGTTLVSFFKVFLTRLFDLETFSHLAQEEVQFLVLTGISISSAIVGTFLILRNMTMLANAISHTILLGIVVCALFFFFMAASAINLNQMSITFLFMASFISGLITIALTEFLKRGIKLQEDASIGLVFTSLFSISILLVTLFTQNAHIGTDLVMGNVDALKREDLPLVYSVLLANIFFILLFFRGFKLTTFDASLSKTFGFSPLFFTTLLMILTSATTMSSFKATGFLMVLVFFVGLPLIARSFTHTLSKLIVVASLLGMAISLLGIALSRHLLTIYGIGLSTGGIIVSLTFALYLSIHLIKRINYLKNK